MGKMHCNETNLSKLVTFDYEVGRCLLLDDISTYDLYYTVLFHPTTEMTSIINLSPTNQTIHDI